MGLAESARATYRLSRSGQNEMQGITSDVLLAALWCHGLWAKMKASCLVKNLFKCFSFGLC